MGTFPETYTHPNLSKMDLPIIINDENVNTKIKFKLALEYSSLCLNVNIRPARHVNVNLYMYSTAQK